MNNKEIFGALRVIGPPTGGNLFDPRGPKKIYDWSQWDTEYIPATGGALEIEFFASRTYRNAPANGTEKDEVDYSLVEEGSLAADEEMLAHGLQIQLLHDLTDFNNVPVFKDYEHIRAHSILQFRRGRTTLRELITERISGPGWVGNSNAAFAGDDALNFGNPLNDFFPLKTPIPIKSSQNFRIVFKTNSSFNPGHALRMRIRVIGEFYKAAR